MKKKERRAIVMGAPMFGGGLSVLSVAALMASNTRARVLVCVLCVPSVGRAVLAELVGVHYVNVCVHVSELVSCGSLVNDRGRLTVTDVGIRELEALANDLLANVERLRLAVSLQRFGRPELLSFGMDEK